MELNNKQYIIEKLLNINSNQSKDNGVKINDNTHVNKNANLLENNSDSKEIPSKNVNNDQNKDGKPNFDSNKRNSPKKKIPIIGNSLLKYLWRENLSSKKNEIKVVAHPGSTTEDISDRIKPVVKKKPHLLTI